MSQNVLTMNPALFPVLVSIEGPWVRKEEVAKTCYSFVQKDYPFFKDLQDFSSVSKSPVKNF